MAMQELIQIKLLKSIKQACADEICPQCPLYKKDECILSAPPEKWDAEDIFDRIQRAWKG